MDEGQTQDAGVASPPRRSRFPWRWPFRWRKPKPLEVLGLAFVVLAAIGVVAHFVEPMAQGREARFGAIHVDQPEIYTRERLVNDRFEQDDWLRARLGKTDQLSFDTQARAKSASSRSTNAEIRAGSEAQNSAPSASAPDATSALAPVTSDPIDDFHDRLAYREEVRSEIIENQLDDSHDIAGNTLYHLKFDTAIIPLDEGVSGFAVVDAAMKGPTPRYFTCDGVDLDQRQFADCVGAFLADLRTLALRMAAERIATERSDEAASDIDEVRNLRDQELAQSLVEKLLERREERQTLREELRKIGLIAEERLRVDALRAQAKSSELLRDETLAEESRLMRGVREQLEQAHELYQSWLEQASLEVNIAMRSKRELIGSALAELNGTAKDARSRALPLDVRLRDFDLGDLADFEEYLRKALGGSCHAGKASQLTARASFLETVDCLLGRRPYEAQFEEHYARWFAQKKMDTAPADYRALVHIEAYGPALRVQPQTITTPIGSTPPDNVFPPAQLHLVKLEPPNDGVPKTPNITSDWTIERQVGFARFLSQLHRASNRAYTYSVRPKESVERIASQTSSAALSQLAAGVGAKLGPEALKSLIVDVKTDSLLTEALERHPLVVGFSRDAERSNTGWAYFGWLIGPRFSGSSADARQVRFAHHAAHQTLSVIISAPSWWREATVALLSYWLSSDGRCFTMEGEEFTCGQNERLKSRQIWLRLPGDAEAVGEVLMPGDLRKSPKVDEGEMATIQVWEDAAADIVIPGRHLWRSTVVALGNQRADRIAVLPDMNGIVAHFKDVQLPPSTDSGPRCPRLNVWTSEGHHQVKTDKVCVHPRRAALPASAPAAAH